MDEIISYKMCAVKVRNAKLRNYLKHFFDLNFDTTKGLFIWKRASSGTRAGSHPRDEFHHAFT